MWNINYIVITIIVGVLLCVLFLLGLLFLPIAFILAFVSLVAVSIYLLKEDISLSHRSVVKSFYCPFRKMFVKVKFRPSLFTYRTFDDVIECTAFKDRVMCEKGCLDMPELKSDSQPAAVSSTESKSTN